MLVLRLVVYTVSVAELASNTIIHLVPSHSTISFALATIPLPSLFCQATGNCVAVLLGSPISSNNNKRNPEVLILVGLKLKGLII